MLHKKFTLLLFIAILFQSAPADAGKKKEKLAQKEEAQTPSEEQSQNQNPLPKTTEEKFSYQPSKEDVELFKSFVEMSKKASETQRLFEYTSSQIIQSSVETQDPFVRLMAQQLSEIQEGFQKTKNSTSKIIAKALADISHIKAEKQRQNFKQKITQKPSEEETIEKKIKKD